MEVVLARIAPMSAALSGALTLASGISRNRSMAASLSAALLLSAGSPADHSLVTRLSSGLTIAAALGKKAVMRTALTGAMSFAPSAYRSVSLASSFVCRGRLRASLDRGRVSIGVCEVLEDTVHLWGFTCLASAPSYAIKRAISDLNSALQVIWNHAEDRDYWTSETLEITVTTGLTSAALTDEIQNVQGTCRLKTSRRPLVPIGTLGELETFTDLYLDSESLDEPVAYHIERKAQVGDDPVKSTFHITPPPTEDTVFLLDVVKEAPRYGITDSTSCPRIPIPHRYVESLLLPVVRKRASSYYLFSSPDKKEEIDSQYAQAMSAIGMADPLPGNAGDNRKERREER